MKLFSNLIKFYEGPVDKKTAINLGNGLAQYKSGTHETDSVKFVQDKFTDLFLPWTFK